MITGGTRLRALAVAVLVVAGCAPGPSPSGVAPSPGMTPSPAGSPTPSPISTEDRNAGWAADLAALVPGMDALHPDLTHAVPRDVLDGAVAALADEIGISSDDRLMVGVLRIVAMVGGPAGCEGHTGVFPWGSGTFPVDSLPLRLWLFDGDVVIVDALPPYEGLVGSRIDTVEGRPMAEVIDTVGPVIPRDNEQTVRLLLPRYLLMPQVLHGLGVADVGPIALGVSAPDGGTSVEVVEPIPMATYNDWAGPYGLHLPEDEAVLSLSRIDDLLWWEVLPDAATLYVQLNRIEAVPSAQLAELRAAAQEPDIERVVVDLRHNVGGEVSAIGPVLELLSDPAIDRPGELFVITGRNTFSAASMLVARLDDGTAARIVGEPMGGCPTLYGNARPLELPFSGLEVSVATELSVGVRADDPRLTIEPDVSAVLTREDWADGRDAALEAIVVITP